MSSQKEEVPKIMKQGRAIGLGVDVVSFVATGSAAFILAGEVLWHTAKEGYKSVRGLPEKLGRQLDEQFRGPSFRGDSGREALPTAA